MSDKILFIVKSEKTPSSRIRALDLLPGLRSAGLECEIEYLPKSFWSRRSLFRKCREFDVVVFQKRLLSYFEFRELRGNSKKLVFDFDDAVYLRNAAPSLDPADYASSTRSRRFARMVAGADLVVAANRVLADAAGSFASNTPVEIIPSSVPLAGYEPKGDYALSEPPVVGWVGTSVTLRYLEFLTPALAELRSRRRFVLRVVSDSEFAADGVDVENVPWSLESESREIRGFDIGIMPLSRDPFSEGKSSYKLLQYMACGVPSVASPVGMNVDVADEGRSADLADSSAEFASAIEGLLDDMDSRVSLGEKGRRKVEREFDRSVVAAKLADVLKKRRF
ncbi:MAG: glycosyltransferase family 4 protein [Kiritimatiellaeota bacterium]|nr:glycosyltransferase family 4 protein [Kiritimatiellota bacterium]